jgi:hypothetical protein
MKENMTELVPVLRAEDANGSWRCLERLVLLVVAGEGSPGKRKEGSERMAFRCDLAPLLWRVSKALSYLNWSSGEKTRD